MPGSATGASEASSTPPTERAVPLWEARALAAAERVRQQGPRRPSESSRPPASPDGEVVRRRLKAGKVPDLYESATWDKVRSPAIKEWCLPIEARLPSKVGTPNWALLGHGLLILGPVGTGKSSAAGLVAKDVVFHDRSVRWSYVPDLADTMALSAKDRAAEMRWQEMADLLIWDDFGVRDLADWEIGYLDQIVEARYRARKPMLVTSNWTAEDLRADQRLARMVDRWRERVCSNVAILTGASMRGA